MGQIILNIFRGDIGHRPLRHLLVSSLEIQKNNGWDIGFLIMPHSWKWSHRKKKNVHLSTKRHQGPHKLVQKCLKKMLTIFDIFVCTAVENVYKYISKLAWFYFCITTRTSSHRRGIMLKYYKYVWKNHFLSRNWQQSENRRLRKWLGLGRGSDQLPCTQGQGFQWFLGSVFEAHFLKSSPRVEVHRNSRL